MPLTVLSGNPSGTFEESQDSAFKVGNPEIYNIPAPASLSGASNTLTAQQVINGVVSEANGGSATTLTLPSARGGSGIAALLRTFSSRGIIAGDSIYLYIINNGAGVMTIANNADNSITFDAGSPATVPANSSRVLLIRFTVGTVGSEAAVLF